MNQNTRKTCTPWTIGDSLGLRPGLRQLLTLAVVSSFALSASAELDLTAEWTPTPGLPGFQTWRITATSDLGNIVGFDFTSSGNYGVTGAMNQLRPSGHDTVYQDSMFAGADPAQDSHFLYNSSDVINLFPTESATDLHAAFALIGDKQLTIGNSVPFLQVATQSPSDIVLKGLIGIRRPDGQMVEMNIDAKLSDIAIGAAPNLAVIPVPPPQPEPVVVVQPPVQPPQVTNPPVVPPNPVIPPPDVVRPPTLVSPPIDVPPTVVTTPENPSVLPVDPNLTIDPILISHFLPVSIDTDGLGTRLIYLNRLPLDLDGAFGATVRLVTTDDLSTNDGSYGYFTDSVNNGGVLTAAPNYTTASFAGLPSAVAAKSMLIDQIDSSQPVPEPTATLLLLFGGLGVTIVSSRRNRSRRGLLANQL